MKSDLEFGNVGRAATMEDIARTLGLTKATVSYALNGKGRVAASTRQAVLDTANRLGFQPNPHAQRLTRGRCHDMVGLFALTLDLGVGTRKLQLIQKHLSEQGYRAPLHVCGGDLSDPENQIEALNSLRLQRPLGIICNDMNLHPTSLRELELYRQEGGNVVVYDVPMEIGCDQVIFDREHNAYLATRHLLELGHRDIALYAGWTKPHPDRHDGYLRALREFGARTRSEWLLMGEDLTDRQMLDPDEHEAIGAQAARLFVKLNPLPTAVCIANDAVAAAFIAEVQRNGLRVPDDVSVVGQDDLPLAQFVSAVPLTTMSQPVEAIASEAVAMLTERLRGEAAGPARRKTLRGELVRRQSTAAFKV